MGHRKKLDRGEEEACVLSEQLMKGEGEDGTQKGEKGEGSVGEERSNRKKSFFQSPACCFSLLNVCKCIMQPMDTMAVCLITT